MDSLLSSLQTKQKELEGDVEREKLEATHKEEVATLKANLEEKDKVTSLSVHYLSTVLTALIQFT